MDLLGVISERERGLAAPARSLVLLFSLILEKKTFINLTNFAGNIMSWGGTPREHGASNNWKDPVMTGSAQSQQAMLLAQLMGTDDTAAEEYT